ncbi:transcriptional regulator [Paenibacillus sp. 1781tsa1]|uniref:ArsR/SmtB family transcription factor n=1 Tax=Paenibacillus sp. 1781tsa1 TaxID=2953810 RepID=UPI00209DCBF9|nr:helix-turn-helix domain-containing protein [Paenibacillus sp. 1781tsa1]MCP1183701.1 helix-turn-helix domain-containing protein [Paenibacillus sp. 1781tsa1]
MQHKVLSTIEEIKIYSDPYRIQIMNMFNKQGRPSTVKEIADQMGEVPAKVHYHVKKLEKIGLLTIVSTREINGIIAKYYEPFTGEIHLRHEDEDKENSPLKQVFRSETLKLLNEMFEQSRQRFMHQAETENRMFLSDITLYATRDEVEELYKNIIKLCEPYTTKENHRGEDEVFQLFSALSKPIVKIPASKTDAKEKKKATSGKGESTPKKSRSRSVSKRQESASSDLESEE